MQLPLPVTLPVDETFSSFVPSDNAEVFSLLTSLTDCFGNWNDTAKFSVLHNAILPLITLRGPTGSGKSHLLFALCHELANKDIPHFYLNLDDMETWSPAIFEGLESLSVLCLDNIDNLAHSPQWEVALFNLLNRVSENKRCVVVCTFRLGRAEMEFTLPDLSSRLCWGITYSIKPLNDEGRKQVLVQRATARGVELSNQALDFLLNHSDRSLPVLISLLDRLDQRSLQEQKKLSVAMVKRELNL